MTLQEQLDQAAEGSVVRIPAGTHAVNVRITRSVTLLGDSATTILDGGGRGSVVQIDAPQATVKLVGLVLQNGDGHAGGGVLLKRGKLELTECVLRQNRAMGFGGGALYSSGQALHVERCQLLGNEALQGGGVLLDGPQRATFTSTPDRREPGEAGRRAADPRGRGGRARRLHRRREPRDRRRDRAGRARGHDDPHPVAHPARLDPLGRGPGALQRRRVQGHRLRQPPAPARDRARRGPRRTSCAATRGSAARAAPRSPSTRSLPPSGGAAPATTSARFPSPAPESNSVSAVLPPLPVSP